MQRLQFFLKLFFFFILGASLSTVIICSLLYLGFSYIQKDKIYPGVKISGIDVSGKTKAEIVKNDVFNYPIDLDTITIGLSHPNASISATGKDLNLHLDMGLMAQRAYSVGRQTANPYWNFLQIVDAWKGNIDLPLEISFTENNLEKMLSKISPKIEKEPINAVYEFVPGAGPDGKGRVTAFRNSENGIKIDREKLLLEIITFAKLKNVSLNWIFTIPTNPVSPNVKSSTADTLGIHDLLGRGESYFFDSIPGRIYNIGLGTGKISGSLIAPGDIFSFDQAIGTVSAVFGYQKAYAIKEGKTILDDGGGVCQVSTTLYRAVLNAGLPVIERAAHSYRVGFYEQGGFAPGLDATVYPPSPDLKFKNDTNGWLLIQTNYDIVNMKLTFDIFGKSDGRNTIIAGPNFLSVSPPPEPIYEDDPAMPAGQIRQIDTAHYGAKVYFQRTVTRGEDILINETVISNYVPWPARYLRGTKI